MTTKIKSVKPMPKTTIKPAISKKHTEYIRNGESTSAIKPHPPKKK